MKNLLARLTAKNAPQPLPRRALHWSMEDAEHGGFRWQCLHCESGTGQHRLWTAANNAAHTHWIAAHVPVGAL